MPRPFFDAARSLSVPRCSDTWQCCDPSLAVLLQAPYCRVPSSPYWLPDQCDSQPGFSTPMAIKHVMLALSDASEGRGGAIAFCSLLANPIMEMRYQVAAWLQVGMCTHVHTDSFKEMYPRLALPSGLQEMRERWALTGMAVSSELESISDAA